MKRILTILSSAAALSLLLTTFGCGVAGTLLDFLNDTDTTTVELRNDSDFPVETTLYYDDDQETVDGVIQEFGEERNYTVPAGSTETFSRSCGELQALIVDDADLSIIGEVGPEAGTDLLRDGDDFNCGDTVVLTFDHSEVIVDFDIQVSTTASD